MNKNYVTVYICSENFNSNIVKVFDLEEFDTLKRSDIKLDDIDLSNVIKIDIPEGVVKVCDGILNKCNLIEIKFPRTLRKIENNNLFLNFYLTSLAVPIEVSDFSWNDYFYRMFFGRNKKEDFNLILYFNDEKELFWYLKSFLKVKKNEVFLAYQNNEFVNRFNLVLDGPTLSTRRYEQIERLLINNEIYNYEFIIDKKVRSYKKKFKIRERHY